MTISLYINTTAGSDHVAMVLGESDENETVEPFLARVVERTRIGLASLLDGYEPPAPAPPRLEKLAGIVERFASDVDETTKDLHARNQADGIKLPMHPRLGHLTPTTIQRLRAIVDDLQRVLADVPVDEPDGPLTTPTGYSRRMLWRAWETARTTATTEAESLRAFNRWLLGPMGEEHPIEPTDLRAQLDRARAALVELKDRALARAPGASAEFSPATAASIATICEEALEASQGVPSARSTR
jgi:hypothetical protein